MPADHDGLGGVPDQPMKPEFPTPNSFSDRYHLAAFIRNETDEIDGLIDITDDELHRVWDTLDEQKQAWVLAQYITYRLERK